MSLPLCRARLTFFKRQDHLFATMQFTSQEKIAVMSLLIEMANADDQIVFEEMIAINLICQKMEIDHDSFIVAYGLKCEHAIEVLKNMSNDKKLRLAQMMVDIIDSDNEVDDREIALLNHACHEIGIDTLL